MAFVYIENLGCAKNQVDAEIMGARLEDAGWTWTDDASRADLIIVNTCGFIEPAQQESIDTTLDFLAAYPDTPVTLAGCMAQRFADELAEGIPETAGVFGNRQPHRILEFIDRLNSVTSDDARTRRPVVWLPDGAVPLVDTSRRRLLSHPGSAYIKIAEGCDHTCSFCAIPSIRGRLRTRDRTSILSEFRALRDNGIYEFNLVAQDLAAWREPGGDAGSRSGATERRGTVDAGTAHIATDGFVSLIETLLEESGSFWLRPLYLYPDTFPQAILDVAAADARLVPYFDLSFQHASTRVLRRMGRPGDADSYLRLIDQIRRKLPNVALRSSFIVGFPGESEDDVHALARFLEAAELEWVGIFEYSPQTGTPAAAMADQIDAAEMTARRQLIERVQEPIVTRRLQRFIGDVLPVLVEERFPTTSVSIGRSPLQAPEVDGSVVVHDAPDAIAPGSVVEVEVTGVTGVDLQGRFRRVHDG